MNHFLGKTIKPCYGRKRVTIEDKFNAIREQADIVFSKWVRSFHAVYGFVICYTCYDKIKVSQSDAGHYINRDNMATRFDERNVKPQCQHCNRELEGNKDAFRSHLVDDYGENEVAELERLGNSIMKTGKHELMDIITKYSK